MKNLITVLFMFLMTLFNVNGQTTVTFGNGGLDENGDEWTLEDQKSWFVNNITLKYGEQVIEFEYQYGYFIDITSDNIGITLLSTFSGEHYTLTNTTFFYNSNELIKSIDEISSDVNSISIDNVYINDKIFDVKSIVIPNTASINTNLEKDYSVFTYNKTLKVNTTNFDDYTVSVYNLSGQEVVNSVDVSGSYETYLGIPEGVYLVKLEDSKNNSFFTKVIL